MTNTTTPYRVLTLAAARKRGLVPITVLASDMANVLPADGTPRRMWEHLTVANGGAYCNPLMRRGQGGTVEVLNADTGAVVMRHPANRRLRTLGTVA